MGKIYELFGVQNKKAVANLPNKSIRQSITSGNYGKDVSFFSISRCDKSNPILAYLLNPNNEKNISYWRDKIENDEFSYKVMKEHFREIGLKRMGGFHPNSYGFKDDGCDMKEWDCDDCHIMALEVVYRYYKRINK